MKRITKKLLIALYFAVLTLATTRPAQATLGESADSVAADRKAFAAVEHATTPGNGYTVQEFKTDANSVREYISPYGVVFAIAWHGLSHPDLSSLLGTYVGEYKQALRHTAGHRGNRHFQLKANRVVVEKWGHMRNMQGRAYIPTLIPSGVSINEIK